MGMLEKPVGANRSDERLRRKESKTAKLQQDEPSIHHSAIAPMRDAIDCMRYAMLGGGGTGKLDVVEFLKIRYPKLFAEEENAETGRLFTETSEHADGECRRAAPI